MRRILLGTALLSLVAVSAVVASALRLDSASAASSTALSPFFSDSGLISLSVDAIGTNDPAGAAINVHKNASGATVRSAFLFAASTGSSGYTPVDGDVTLDGTPIAWDSAHTIGTGIASVNVEADVTALVKAKVDAAGAGDVSFIAAEPTHSPSIDGEILAVILNDPTVTKSGSVTLLYGAQDPLGDTFHATLANPVDKTDPTFALNLSLGISFGFQPTGQFSTVDVNGTRMTSSAGGQDDCAQKYAATPNFGSCGNGELITAGGIGDSNDNPPDPNAEDTTCVNAASQPAPRCDDELYNLLPFVNNGDTSLTFNTTNPSDNDNIFFAALDVHSSAAVVGEGVVLSPSEATNNVGDPHTLTATVQDDQGNPISGVTVHFAVTSGPNAGTNGDAVTGADGKAQFTYTSSTAGTDHIVASFVDAAGAPHTSNEATKTWVGAATPTPTDTVEATATSTPTSMATATSTPTANVTSVSTRTPVVTRTVQATRTVGATRTVQATRTAPATRTAVATATEVPPTCLTLARKARLTVGILRHFGQHANNPHFNAKFDVNHDGVINLDDLLAVLGAPTCVRDR